MFEFLVGIVFAKTVLGDNTSGQDKDTALEQANDKPNAAPRSLTYIQALHHEQAFTNKPQLILSELYVLVSHPRQGVDHPRNLENATTRMQFRRDDPTLSRQDARDYVDRLQTTLKDIPGLDLKTSWDIPEDIQDATQDQAGVKESSSSNPK